MRPAKATDGAGAGRAAAAAPAPDEGTDLGEALTARLRVAVTRLHRRLRQESLAGLSPAQASALSSINRLGRPTLGELAQAEMVQPPSVTPVVAAMQEAGLVTRLADPADRRVSRVELTARGRNTLEQIRTVKNAYLVRRLDAVGPSQRALVPDLVALLERLAGGE